MREVVVQLQDASLGGDQEGRVGLRAALLITKKGFSHFNNS